MSEYLIEYYTQRKDYINKVSADQDHKLKDLIACFAVHLTARTALETHAWTFNIIHEKPYSLFVTGSTGEIGDGGIAVGFLVGNILTENIRHSDTNGIHAQCVMRGRTFNSYVPCDTDNIASMVEAFYRQSEQLPLRIKLSEKDDTAIGIAALPGYSAEWFDKVDIENFAATLKDEDKSLMRTCKFSFTCDCSPEKLLPFFSALSGDELNDLYGDDKELLITCPRCGRNFPIERNSVKNNKEKSEKAPSA